MCQASREKEASESMTLDSRFVTGPDRDGDSVEVTVMLCSTPTSKCIGDISLLDDKFPKINLRKR